MNDKEKFITYEFYQRVPDGEDRFIGALPEKRKAPERITYASIMNWVRIKMPEEFFHGRIYFLRVKL